MTSSYAASSPYGTIYPWQKGFGRYLELICHARETGRPLPMLPGKIMEIEVMGGVVDLETGEVEWLLDDKDDGDDEEETL